MLLHFQVPACEAKLIQDFLRRNHVSGPSAAVVLLVGLTGRIAGQTEKTLCIIKYGNQGNKADNSYPADDAPMVISRGKGPSVYRYRLYQRNRWGYEANPNSAHRHLRIQRVGDSEGNPVRSQRHITHSVHI